MSDATDILAELPEDTRAALATFVDTGWVDGQMINYDARASLLVRGLIEQQMTAGLTKQFRLTSSGLAVRILLP